jgi:hypothetical protein
MRVTRRVALERAFAHLVGSSDAVAVGGAREERAIGSKAITKAATAAGTVTTVPLRRFFRCWV